MEYSREFGSNFPSELIPVGTKKDVDDSVKDLITQYYQLVESGSLDMAAKLYEDNQNILSEYAIKMSDINRFEEEIYNIGLDVLKKLTTIINDKEPATQSNGSFWYREV